MLRSDLFWWGVFAAAMLAAMAVGVSAGGELVR